MPAITAIGMVTAYRRNAIMVPKPVILLLIPHLGGGGAERVIAHLARFLPGQRFEVHLGVVTRGEMNSEAFPRSVRVHQLHARRVLFGAADIVRLVWKVKPDLILSGIFHLNFLVLLLRPLFPRATRILVRQNGMLSGIARLTRCLYRKTYPRADGIIVQTRAMEEEMRALLGSGAKLHVLRNPVDTESMGRAAERNATPHGAGPGPHLLAVGRLSPEKGFDLLLEAFAAVRVAHPDADLVIVGDGVERTSLQARSAALGLDSSVRFTGYVADPASWFAGASLLVIPSRCEALPNVLLEGAAAGLPIVALPSSAGMTELIRGQSGIWLARDLSSESLARAIEAALAILKPRQRFAHPWLAPFALREAVGHFEALILKTMGEARATNRDQLRAESRFLRRMTRHNAKKA